MLTSLQGKSVLVTGGTSGIGLGIAVGFARQGAKVAISGRQRDKVEAVASRLRDQGLAVTGLVADVAQREQVRQLVEQVVQAQGGLDVLCANAGVFPSAPLEQMTDADWDLVLDTNVVLDLFVYEDPATVPLRAAYTYTDGKFTKSATNPGVLKGDVIDYLPKHLASLQLGVEHERGWSSYAALNFTDGAYTSTTAERAGVDDRYLKTDSLVTLDLVAKYPLNATTEVYARIDNVLDQRYIGSVIVNDGNQRFFEPGPDRRYSVGVQWAWQ